MTRHIRGRSERWREAEGGAGLPSPAFVGLGRQASAAAVVRHNLLENAPQRLKPGCSLSPNAGLERLLHPAPNSTGKIHDGAVRNPSHISTTLFFNSAVNFAYASSDASDSGGGCIGLPILILIGANFWNG